MLQKSLFDTPITLSELESHLREAANILGGSSVDRTDWKSYILPLLFFKHICDGWDEEHEAMLAEYGDDFADEHRFQVPEEAHWRAVRETPASVGIALQNAMRAIEKANQKHLYGVFGDAQWTNKERLPDELLKDLVEHFSAFNLGSKRVDSDLLGDAYEYLIKKFADTTRNKAGEFYTPCSVVRLMVDILDPQEVVYDPACGTGGMLLADLAHVWDRGGAPHTFFGRLYGQEKNLTTASTARMNLLLHGLEDPAIKRGDTLREPVFTDLDIGGLARFDVVIANPPFSPEQWGREIWESDAWGRDFAELPTDSSGDFAWVQHMVQSMALPHGRMGVVLPQGALFRGGAEGQIRRGLLEKDLIEAVIGLAPNLFYGTELAACILVLRQRKLKERAGKVLIADASALFHKGRTQNFLGPEHAAEILKWYTNFADVEDAARVVTLEEIAREDWTLNISRYVLPPISDEIQKLLTLLLATHGKQVQQAISDYVILPALPRIAKADALQGLINNLPKADQAQVLSEILEFAAKDADLLQTLIERVSQDRGLFADAATNLATYTSAVDELKDMVNATERVSEARFQALLTDNPWMFGSEYSELLKRRKLTRDEQQDFVVRRTADNYIEIIEIKTPLEGKLLFNYDASHKSYYQGVELAKVIGQVQQYLEKLDENRLNILFSDQEDTNKIRAKIIIGRNGDENQQQALRRLNGHLHRIEVITFDQLVCIAERVLSFQQAVLKPREQ